MDVERVLGWSGAGKREYFGKLAVTRWGGEAELARAMVDELDGASRGELGALREDRRSGNWGSGLSLPSFELGR